MGVRSVSIWHLLHCPHCERDGIVRAPVEPVERAYLRGRCPDCGAEGPGTRTFSPPWSREQLPDWAAEGAEFIAGPERPR